MKPILFNTEMVQAILNGCKTVTRRVVKPQPTTTYLSFAKKRNDIDQTKLEAYKAKIVQNIKEATLRDRKPPYQPGDILWVRETWAPFGSTYLYKANGGGSGGSGRRPSIHMPREAARIFLRVTNVRVERLREMNVNDFLREGICLLPKTFPDAISMVLAHAKQFKGLWDSTVKPADLATYGYDANPWVWVIGFERCERGVTHD